MRQIRFGFVGGLIQLRGVIPRVERAMVAGAEAGA
jgi:hypothetical protein